MNKRDSLFLLDVAEQRRKRITALEAALREINMVCAGAPPCDELDEDGELYNSLVDNIQNHVRRAFASETSAQPLPFASGWCPHCGCGKNDPDGSVVFAHLDGCAMKTSAETKTEPHVHRWTSKRPDAFCEDCLAERYPTENPPGA